MPGQVTLVAVIVLLLGTILGYFVGLRAVKASRRLANFRLRQGEVRKARVAFVGGTLLAMLSIVVLAAGQRSGGIPASLPPSATVTLTAPPTASMVPTVWFPPSSTATFFSLTATPVASATAPATQRPALPLSIEAIFQGTVTPGADLRIGTLRFSTEMRGSQPVGPGNRFRNPLKRMFTVFSYQNMQPGTQWTVLWYVNGELKYFETKVWDKASSGLSFAVWEQPAEKWLPGTYEVHIYAGSEWKASGSFELSGEPPTTTPTRTASASPTASQIPSATVTRTPAATPTPTSTATQRPTLTSSATASRTATPPRPLPSPEAPSGTPSRTQAPTASPTASLTATVAPSAAASGTATPTATPTITRTVTASVTPTLPATPTATLTASPTATWTATATGTPATTTVRIYFTNSRRLANRTPPYEEGVLRQISSSTNPISAALDEYFTGPNAVEQSRGLSAVWNGFIGYRRAEFSNGTLHVHLIGYCRSSGGGYNIATPLFLTLKQFPGVNHVKLYDEYERTHDAAGENDSAPDCISVPFTPIPSSTPTRTPTRTPRPPTLTATALPSPTASPRPSATATFLPSATTTPPPSPTATVPTATPTASRTPVPTSTRVPTRTASPTVTATVPPSSTPTSATVQVGIYFTDLQKLQGGTLPFEELVVRQVPSSMNPVVAVLDEYFRGPSAEEQSRGLTAVWNGFVGYRRADFSNGMLEIYLAGRCQGSITGYSIAQPLTASLKQIPGVRYVKLYDQYDRTRDPLSESDSAPACLEATATPPPSLTPSATATHTATPRPSATVTPLPTPTPTRTPTPIPPSQTPRPMHTATTPPTVTASPRPSATATPVPTRTPTRTPTPIPPSQTPSPTLTATAKPSATPTSLPTRTPTPIPLTHTPRPTETPTTPPTMTATPRPSATTTPLPTRTPTKTPTRVPPTHTPRPTETATALPTLTATVPPSLTPTRTPPPSLTPTQSPIPTNSPTARPSSTPTALPTATPLPTRTPKASPSSTPTAQPSSTWTASPVATNTASRTPTVRPTFTVSPTRTLAATATQPPSATFTNTALPTQTSKPPTATSTKVRPTATKSPTPLPTATRTASATSRPTATWTVSPVPTGTKSPTPLPTATRTASLTPRPSATWTMSPTPTATRTPNPSPTASRTASPTATLKPSATWTMSPVPTATRTLTPSPTATPTASPTATPKPSATRTASPTATATRTRTPTATATIPADCNRAGFVGDVTIRDLEIIPAGRPFTKTWRIKNEGTCTWTTAYRLIFVAGTPMDTPNWIALPGPVEPGQTIDLSVDLVAPAAPGRYEGYWMLQTPAGTIFGVGRSSDQPVWVKIRVTPAPASSETPTATAPSTPEATLTVVPPTSTPADFDLHLAMSACEAQWVTSTGVLPCPGSGSGEAGSVLPLGQASLEDGSTGGPALMIMLPSAQDVYVQGIYPQREVQAGDRLQARVGCAENAASCSVLFRAGYQDEAGQTHELWSIGEFYDGKVFDLDLDLSPLAGQKVRFILGVSSLGPAEGDRPIWVDPRVVHSSPVPTATPPEATPSPTPGQPTPSVSPAPPAPTASATPAVPTGNPSPLDTLQRLLEAIARFIRQLFGG